MKTTLWPQVKFVVVLITFIGGATFCLANTLNTDQLEDKQAAKEANINEAEKLNTATEVNSESARERIKQNQETANIVNQVPGVKVKAEDLEPPEQPPIKGFHPIKRLLRPVENLEGMSIKLEQQIMKLEGPIAGLQPPMLNLQKKMVGVDEHLGTMEDRLKSVETQVKDARSDIDNVRAEINALRQPITDLRGPIGTVAKPLEAVQAQLNLILLAILFTAIVIAVGTPIAAIQVYRNRQKIFPDLREHELPKAK